MTEQIEERIRAIAEDRTHGAAFLAREALATMKVVAAESRASDVDSFLEEMARLGVRLTSLRPSMSAPIANGVVRLFDAVRQVVGTKREMGEVKNVVRETADHLLAVMEDNVRRTVANASAVIPRAAGVLTHSYSETCLRALIACREKGVWVLVTESRPLLEGTRTAHRLQEAGIRVSLVTDAEAGHFMSAAQVVLVGADTVLADGSVVNKMGTYLIALAAKDRGVPFHVACDSWKFRVEPGVPELEEMNPEEVVGKSKTLAARNIYFDVAPARLVSGLITEDGAVGPNEVTARTEKWRNLLAKMVELGLVAR